jgi:N-acetylmuramate 1-kinase
MKSNKNKIERFLSAHIKSPFEISKIEGSASDRSNFRVSTASESFVLTEGNYVEENRTFFLLSDFFASIGDFTPRVLFTHKDQTLYLQENVGEKCLLEQLKSCGENENTKTLFKQSLEKLVQMQVFGGEKIDPKWLYDYTHFDYLTVMHDLFYFKHFFLDLLAIPYSKNKLLQDFDQLAKKIDAIESTSFMHRDFQSRNIMIKENKVFVIDFQGGMMGLPVYDLVSLIWQSRANLSESFKQELKLFYFETYNKQNKQTKKSLSKDAFEQQYELCLTVRLLQVLGAYGFRGIYEKKNQFTESIFEGIGNLEHLLGLSLIKQLPCLNAIIIELSKIPNKKINNIIHAK